MGTAGLKTAPRAAKLRTTLRAATLTLLASGLCVGCSTLVGPAYTPPPPPSPPPKPARQAPPPAPAQPTPPPAPPQPPSPAPQPPHQFSLGAAAAALVALARREAANGNPQLAQSTVERALRIEPQNPLLWIMLGEAHQGEGQYQLAGSMGRKALQLAAGDTRTEARAWRLIGDSLRAQGDNRRANDAYSHADQLQAQ
ncbi:MAG: tetratricopeptide repeat protein [Steroidobacteraceae bacterium]